MIKLDKSQSLKSLLSKVDTSKLPKELQVSFDKMEAVAGIDKVTGADKEVKEMFSVLEKYYPASLPTDTKKTEEKPKKATKEDVEAGVESLEELVKFVDEEDKVKEIKEAIETLKLALDIDL